MIDFGLVVSLLAAIGLPTMLARRWAPADQRESTFLDDITGPLVVGLVTGRLVTLALDDPTSLGSVSDMLVIRSGVEFWPGVAAAVLFVAWSEHRAGRSPVGRLAEIAPLAMVGYATYEAACVFRDGCLGPVSPVGLRPPGVRVAMLPIGWAMSGATMVGAVAVRRLAGRHRPLAVVAVAACWVAVVRSVGSVWLPHLGDAMTRQHRSSIAVLVLSGVVAVAASRRYTTTPPTAAPHDGGTRQPPT